ncbi:MAG: DUF202 domain-containing protein [Acidimicrobiales bacterium]
MGAAAGETSGIGEAGGLQHERTSLAWERTGIAMMVSGLVLVRFAELNGLIRLSGIGVIETVGGGLLLWWAARHDDELHNPAAPASAVPRVGQARVMGLSTVAFTSVSLLIALVVVLRDAA